MFDPGWQQTHCSRLVTGHVFTSSSWKRTAITFPAVSCWTFPSLHGWHIQLEKSDISFDLTDKLMIARGEKQAGKIKEVKKLSGSEFPQEMWPRAPTSTRCTWMLGVERWVKVCQSLTHSDDFNRVGRTGQSIARGTSEWVKNGNETLLS